MRSAIWVLNIFAALWGVAAIMVGHLPEWLVFVPMAISGALLVWASRHPVGTGNPVEGNHVGRLVAIASALEVIAIVITQNVLIKLHLQTALLPAVVIIVGLHFFPLARGIPVPIYYRTGGALVAVGLLALLLPSPVSAIAAGLGAALVLWSSGIVLVTRGRG
jgi:hypothetical protein